MGLSESPREKFRKSSCPNISDLYGDLHGDLHGDLKDDDNISNSLSCSCNIFGAAEPANEAIGDSANTRKLSFSLSGTKNEDDLRGLLRGVVHSAKDIGRSTPLVSIESFNSSR
mmetsp:Transcript_986/g.1619  ORF Transcript_986/g.1619 Transcript_986/m.1619 type:complete len:114 (-) Transcript_986:670-1011(-)